MTLLALAPLLAVCAVAGSLIGYPFGYAAGHRAATPTPSPVVTPRAPHALPAAPAPARSRSPRWHHGEHRASRRESLARWWATTTPRTFEQPATSGSPEPPAALPAPAWSPDPVWMRTLAPDWRARGTGPIPVVQVFTDADRFELIGAAT